MFTVPFLVFVFRISACRFVSAGAVFIGFVDGLGIFTVIGLVGLTFHLFLIFLASLFFLFE